MARITVEDCLEKVDNQYDLVLLAKERTVQLNAGSPMLVEEDNDKRTIISLREIGDGKIDVKEVEASAIKRLRKEPDDLEELEETEEETNDEFENLKPEIVVTIGGLIVSKKIKAFLRQFKPNQHWHVGYTRANDTFFVLDKRFTLSLDEFFNSFIKSFDISTASNYESTWLNVFKYRESRHNQYLSSLDFCDLKVYEILIKNLPQNINLQLSNSTSVRYTQLFNLDSSIKVFCNRGTSGIDGSTSTAIGAAIVNKDQTIFITGDLSFFYDSNAFWNNYIPASFRVIIVNNSGGGIFRILPGNKGTDYYDTFFETTHNLNASNLCEMHGVGYQSASSTNELKEKLHMRFFFWKYFSPRNFDLSYFALKVCYFDPMKILPRNNNYAHIYLILYF